MPQAVRALREVTTSSTLVGAATAAFSSGCRSRIPIVGASQMRDGVDG
jgi:hypothetical protein